MLKIRCVVERITYQNPENGYTVLKTRVKGYKELVPVTGNLLDVNVGSVLLVEGNWKIDARYGRQFIAEKWEETLPATVYGIEKYLGSGLIKGIGPKYAKKIVQEFGTDTISVIEDNIEQLLNVGGIGRKRVEMIQRHQRRSGHSRHRHTHHRQRPLEHFRAIGQMVERRQHSQYRSHGRNRQLKTRRKQRLRICQKYH